MKTIAAARSMSVVLSHSAEQKGQKGHLSKVLTSAEKLLRFGVGGNKLLSSFNQVIYPHSNLCLTLLRNVFMVEFRSGAVVKKNIKTKLTCDIDFRWLADFYFILFEATKASR